MNGLKKYFILLVFPILSMVVLLPGCFLKSSAPPVKLTDTLNTNINGEGYDLQIHFVPGPAHNYPLMAVWVEDTLGKYIETLYVAESIAKGVFKHGETSTGKWLPGPIRRPAALPYWAHRRGVQEKDGWYVPTPETALPDAITGATPKNEFVLFTKTSGDIPIPFYVYFEINQTWDWNEYWTNNKYPDDEEYKTSCQPALVYRCLVDTLTINQPLEFQLIGHSHYSGKDGSLTTDLSTITTALDITKKIELRIQ